MFRFTLSFVVVVSMIALPGSVFGQSCATCICVADNTCHAEEGCLEAPNCTSKQFTVPCTGTYTLTARITCSGAGACADCYACARVIDGNTGSLLQFQHTGCNENCVNFTTTVTLYATASTPYRLEACLIPCTDDDCEECTTCTARATISYNADDCVPLPQCNP